MNTSWLNLLARKRKSQITDNGVSVTSFLFEYRVDFMNIRDAVSEGISFNNKNFDGHSFCHRSLKSTNSCHQFWVRWKIAHIPKEF